jgi:hypothetical protein
MSTSNEDRELVDRRDLPTVDDMTFAHLVRLRMHVLQLLQDSESAGLVSNVNAFNVQGGVGCSCAVKGGTSIAAHFLGPVNVLSGMPTGAIWVWNSRNTVNPDGTPVAGKTAYSIEPTDELTKHRQTFLLDFIQNWIETGKHGPWK